MKKIYSLVACLSIAGTGVAQNTVNADNDKLVQSPLHYGAKENISVNNIHSNANERSVVTYWEEDFDNGLAGQGTNGTWVVTQGSGVNPNVTWTATNTGHNNNAGSTYQIPALATSTPNMWMIIDSDSYGASGNAEESILTSPTIDLTGTPTPAALLLQWDQFFAEWQLDTLRIGVSADGGVTWTEVDVSEGVGRDNRPNPESMNVDISSTIAGAVSLTNVKVRFRWIGNWDYGWQIDNVKIVDKPDNELRLISGGFRSSTPNLFGSKIGFTMIPESQTTAMEVFGTIENTGALTQPNTMLTGNVDFGGSSFFSGSSAVPANLAPTASQIDSVLSFTPVSQGMYDVTAALSYDSLSVDADTSNNSAMSSFEVTAKTYGRDLGIYNGVGLFNGDDGNGVGNPYTMGTQFDITNAALLGEVQVALTPSTVVGAEIYPVIIECDPSATDLQGWLANVVYDGSLIPNGITAVTAADTSGNGNVVWMTLDILGGGLSLNAGSQYMVGIATAGTDVVTIMSVDNVFTPDVTNYVFDANGSNNGTAQWFWLSNQPAIRAGLEFLSVDDLNTGITLEQNIPNPANNSTQINYSLENANDVKLEVVDLTGKVILSLVEGIQSAGAHNIVLNTNNIANGLYYYTLYAGNNKMTKRMVISK